jgi:hypothetical protein
MGTIVTSDAVKIERFFAKRMNARSTEIKSSQVIFLSHPQAVVRVIRKAAGGS